MGDDLPPESRFPILAFLKRINIASPAVQFWLVLGVEVLLMAAFRAFRLDREIWLAAAGLLLLYALLNPFLGLRAVSYGMYTFKSTAILVLLLFTSVTIADRISRISHEEFGPEAMIFLAPVLYYPFSLIVALAVRLIMRRRGRGPRGGSRP